MSFILDLIFPKRCYVCHRFGDYLCPECSSGLIPNAITNMPNSFFEGRLSLFPYKDCLQDLLYDLKYNFVTDLIPDLTSLVSFHLRKSFPHLLSYWQKDDFVLVPIPLHTYRQNWRGFNQSQLIAQSLADDLHLGCLPDLLLRRTHSPPQAQLKRSARLISRHLISFSLMMSTLLVVPSNLPLPFLNHAMPISGYLLLLASFLSGNIPGN